MRQAALRLLVVAALASAAYGQGPGNGVSKTTVASTWPWPGMAFVQKYFPTTCAEDSGSGNVDQGYTFQGRSQLTLANQFSDGRNCKLFSTADGLTSGGSGTALTPPGTNYGSDCTYTASSEFTKPKLMYSVYAHTADQCCKACQAASIVAGGLCVGAVFTDPPSVARDTDESGNETLAQSMLELDQGPQRYEGFGLHLVDVSTSNTTGGKSISALEQIFTDRLGDMSAYDAFMDYNVVLYAGDDMPSYASALSADGVDVLTGVWMADDGSAWHSLLIHVPHSQSNIELVSQTAPGTARQSAPVKLEARISSRQVKRFAKAGKANGVLQAVAVTRACSNMSSIDYFYTQAIQAESVQSLKADGVARKCYAWSGAAADVCFVHRSDGALGTTSDAAKAFTVLDLETTIWAGHKAMIGDISGVKMYTDQYNDNHYAVDLMGFSGTNIGAFFTEHQSEAFPIDFPKTYFAWDCDQSYIIDPTGWAIQSDFQGSNWPGCGYAKSGAARASAAAALVPVRM